MRVLLDTDAYSALKRGHAGVAAVLRGSDVAQSANTGANNGDIDYES